MPFPEVARVVYGKNPLTDVICQLRFPPILKIDSEIPYIFQEKIKDHYPFYQEKKEVIKQIIPDNPQGKLDQFFTKSSSFRNHEFQSEDNSSRINITRNFIALSTNTYARWETFSDSLKSILDIFNMIYTPPFYTRIGLRYTDIFNRSKLGLSNVGWDELIKTEFLGLLSTSFSENIENSESVYEIKLDDNLSMVRIMTSLIKENETHEKCYMVDSDFFNSQRIKVAEVSDKLNYFHERSTRLIQYIIKEKLHLAMEPKLI